MSKCRTCEYALYDGMCLAQGKFTLLDAPACDDYKPRIDVEVSKLKAENAKLKELVQDMWFGNLYYADGRCDWCRMGCEDDEPCSFWMRMRELGIEVEQ